MSEAEKAARLHERSLELEKLKKPVSFPKQTLIYFGSQTGTAEKFAHVLDEEAHKLQVESRVVDFDKFDPDEFLSQSLVIICIATHYEGDPTDNSKKFHKWLKAQVKKQETDEVKHKLNM